MAENGKLEDLSNRMSQSQSENSADINVDIKNSLKSFSTSFKGDIESFLRSNNEKILSKLNDITANQSKGADKASSAVSSSITDISKGVDVIIENQKNSVDKQNQEVLNKIAYQIDDKNLRSKFKKVIENTDVETGNLTNMLKEKDERDKLFGDKGNEDLKKYFDGQFKKTTSMFAKFSNFFDKLKKFDGVHVQLHARFKAFDEKGSVIKIGWGHSLLKYINNKKEFKNIYFMLVASAWGNFCSENNLPTNLTYEVTHSSFTTYYT